MIEIAPREYWSELNFADTKLYCFCLNIDGKTGWRLPTADEYDHVHGVCGWTIEDIAVYEFSKHTLLTSPVRDLKDN